MEHIEFLKEVAQELGQQNILNGLNAIQKRASQQNANLLIPLVGEFSSVKNVTTGLEFSTFLSNNA